MRKIFEIIKNVTKNMIPDKMYLKIIFYLNMGERLDLKNPKTFNQKLQWLKLYDRNPYYTQLVDKYKVKQIIADKIGMQYVVPTYGVWSSFDEIDFDKLPEKYVLKCTHDCGSVFLINNKSDFDLNKVKIAIEAMLKHNYYYAGREWPYKNVEPRIIAEEYLEDESAEKDNTRIRDYKFYCFDGKAVCVMVCIGRESGNPQFYYFDKDWKFLRFDKRSADLEEGFTLEKPSSMDKMFDLAEILSAGLKHVRVDFYEVNQKIYFGELTFFSAGGFDKDITCEADRYFGTLLKI